jgi:hypothetical protein
MVHGIWGFTGKPSALEGVITELDHPHSQHVGWGDWRVRKAMASACGLTSSPHAGLGIAVFFMEHQAPGQLLQ